MAYTNDPNALDDTAARLELNSRGYRPDATLDRLADLIEEGPAAWASIPPRMFGEVEMHQQLRQYYRDAQAAGVIPSDGPSAA